MLRAVTYGREIYNRIVEYSIAFLGAIPYSDGKKAGEENGCLFKTTV